MSLENEKAIREQLISEGYKPNQIDAMHNETRTDYSQIKKMGDTIKKLALRGPE